MPWKTMDVREQRVQFVVAASRREKSLSAGARSLAYGVPPATFGESDMGSKDWPGLPSGAGGRNTVHDTPRQSCRKR